MTLREKVAAIVFDADGSNEWAPEAGERAKQAAIKILNLPEIKQAFAERAQFKELYEDAIPLIDKGSYE